MRASDETVQLYADSYEDEAARAMARELLILRELEAMLRQDGCECAAPPCRHSVVLGAIDALGAAHD